jgi:acetyltransferase-like isoleucine patch superfamily enzyme
MALSDIDNLPLRTRSSFLWKVFKRFLKSLAKILPGNQIRRGLLRTAGYRIGQDVYIGEDLIIIDELEETGYLHIGDRVAIAERVTLVIASRPNNSRIASHVPTAHGPIIIEDDAWLGTGAIILPNVKIGRGSVVGAQSLVTKDVPPFTIVMGSPAKHYKTIDYPQRGGPEVYHG